MNGDHGYQLSPSQETLWFLAQMGPVASAAYNVVLILRFTGPLDTGALERSIAAVAQRQEILRAYFLEDHGSPRLHLADRHLGRLEFRELPAGREADEAAREITAELSAIPFDLAVPPLLRTVLLRGAGVDYLLLIAHHTIVDGWSLGIFLEELRTFYRADRRGQPAVLAALPRRFVELVEQDRRREGSAELQRSLESWKKRLAGAPALLELPADRPRPAVKLYQGSFFQGPTEGPTVEQVRQLARGQRTTNFAPLCAAFVLLLWRLGGRRDVVIGTPVANRPTVDHEAVIGPLINSLVLRNLIAPEQSFGQLMKQVQTSLLEALPDAKTQFEKVVEAINPERRDDVDPIFQVMFSLEAPLATDPHFDEGLVFDTIEPQIRTAPLDLTLTFVQNEKPHLDFGFTYDSSLFERASIELFSARLLTILTAAVEAPERPVGEIPWQSAAELRLLESWNDRHAPFPAAATLPDFLAGRAALTPERMAVEAGGAKLSFGELAAGAVHLAERLRRLGAGPDVPVGLLLERTIDLPVAVHGVLAAGAAYLPLDPSYPPERLRYMLEDSGAPLLLTQGGLAARLGLDGLPGCRVVDLDALGAEPSGPGEEPAGAAPAARAENLAYLLYTSGSTGQPKGVAITHRSLVNFLVSMARQPGLGSDDVLLAITTLSFDIAALELYLPLVCGARLVLLDRESAADVRTLQAAIVDSKVSVLQATPATWQMLIAYRWPGSPGLKALCGGEGLPVALAEALLERVGELWNVYGPTEATVWSSARRVLPGEASRSGETTVTLGRPIANTEIHILDQSGARQGIGIPGELAIGGSGLARGYWRRPGLSADRFVPDALSGRAGDRLYRTGDLARWRTSGELEFLGRLDFQVKVRGFRIELGEIENALAAHPAVADRVVVALKGPGGEARLVAYVVPADPSDPPAADQLQAFLGRGLPSHMVPAAFVFLPALPLTPNLKVDRKALPPPGAPTAAKTARPPQSGVEQRLQPILGEVLGLETVDPGANFFALGGHSLLATRVLARIRDEFGLSLPVRAVFRYPTLGQLAAHLEELSPQLAQAPAAPGPQPEERIAAAPAPPAATAPPERPSPAPAILATAIPAAARAATAGEQLAEELAGPLTFGQERLWLVSQLGAGANASYNITTTLRFRGVLDPGRLERTFLEIIERHPILRTAIELEGGRPVQRVLPRIDWRLQVVDLPGSEAERGAAAVAIAEGLEQQPFALDAPPLFRLILGRTATRESWLLSAFHHTIFDGYSFSILFTEMSEIYAALGEGRAPALAPPGLRMTTLARRQRERLASGALDGELDFWRRKLAGAPPLLELPADRPRPPLPSFAGGRHRWPLPEPVVGALRRLPEWEGKSSFAPLMAAFAMLLSRLAGQSDLVVGTPISHRNEKQLESLIGFLVQTALLRVEVDRETSYLELVKAVQESLFETLEHLELPFEQLVEKLAAERSASFNPLFQVMFVLDQTPPAEPILGLRYDEVAPPRRASHFDLTLLAIEEADGITLVFDYATDLFDARTIAGWAGLYTRLLAAAVADPDAPLGSLDPLGPAERKSLFTLSSGGRRLFELGDEPTLFDLFARQAARTPSAPAVAAADAEGRFTEWSYAELAERAAAVAAELAAGGLPAGAPVALAFGGGGWAIAALLGVLQAGGCYLPLDPGAPPARLSELIAASGATLLLFESRRPPEPALFGGRQVAVDQLPLRPAPARRVDAGLPAYLIFTSGSTGTPKGVLVAHRSAVNLTHAFTAAHRFRAGQRWLVVPPLYFDASVGDIFPALATGGTLVFHGAPERLDADALLAFCGEQRITVIDTAAALFKQWVDSWRTLGRRRVLPELEILMAGGEAVGVDQVAAWHAMHGGQAVFYNHYGPTETTVCATLCATRDGAGFGGSTLPIGRPLANVATYVASRALELQPAGVPGELLIGGAGVALGYLGAPARTAEAFVPDPFSGAPGARLYRTGDLVRLRTGGELEFLGRADRQVKLRGYRIELGEIEAQLRRHPAIAEALVMVREDQPGARRLVAYLRAVAPAAAAELQQLAQERLPAYMAPSAFVFLDSFPLTPNGKIDQRALPAPAAAEREKRPLAGEAQQRLAAIWRELLGGEPAAGDDFFESGGSSLLLMQLAARLRQETGREVPLPSLFEASRLEDMARLLAAGAPAAAGPALDLEVALDEEIKPSRRPLRAVGERWSLVTGGTGFLGAYLIDELLRRERGSIYVLVRAESADDARRRLRQNLRQYGLWRDDAAFRLVPVLGQLDLPRFGLAPEAFAELAQSIDVIFHNAATVNFLAPYAKLEAVNVKGTEETIRLAAAGGAVPLHFVSTLGVFLQQRYELQTVREEDDPAWEGLHKGYEQTKWVAEKLVETARRRGLPASVHRPARVSGASRTGAANTADLFYSLLRGCSQLGAAPELDDPIDLYPVDVLARAMVAISQRFDGDPEWPGRSFHYYNEATVPFAEMIRSLVRRGAQIELVPYADWRRRLLEAAESGQDNALAPFLGLYPPEAEEDRQPVFDQLFSRRVLSDAGIEIPPADEKLLSAYWTFLFRSGFLATRR